MIRKRTVFVLGAGASAPYGFPLGGALVDEICRHLRSSTDVASRVHEAGFALHDIHRFRDDLAESGRASIDAFLEKRPSYLPVGKACIAAALIPYEHEDELSVLASPSTAPDVNERRARRWYHYLFDQMLAGGNFSRNQLSVITFNFDRSFERAMYRIIRANHEGDDETVRRLCAAVPVIHLHGALGIPSWLRPTEGYARPYDTKLDAETVKNCADQIRLVTEEIDPHASHRAREWLQEAEVVCFLGFSYHPLNLRKLDHNETIIGRGGKVVRGTCFKMTMGPRGRVLDAFPQAIALHDADWDILRFLQDTDVIHG